MFACNMQGRISWAVPASVKRCMALSLIGIFVCASNGCSHFRKITMPDDTNLLSGAGTLADEKFEMLDLDKLTEQSGLKLDSDVTKLTDNNLAQNANALRYRRNNLQDRIIAASNQRCGAYLRMLISAKAQNQVLFGDLGALLTGASLVIPHVQTAKALTAAGTFSNTVATNYDAAYFNSLTSSLIVSGIGKYRYAIMERINQDRTLAVSDYSPERAIADALEYHAACNVVSGLEAAAAATKGVKNEDLVGKPNSLAKPVAPLAPNLPENANGIKDAPVDKPSADGKTKSTTTSPASNIRP